MSTITEGTPFLKFLRQGLENGGFQTDDTLSALLPLFRQISEAHDRGQVAPLRGTEALEINEAGEVTTDAARFEAPQRNATRVAQILATRSQGVEVVGESRVTNDINTGAGSETRLDMARPGDAVTKPVFIHGYQSWEHAVGHHDPVTDIFSLGLLLASVACGLDFTLPDDLELFASRRENLFALNDRLHPVLANVIVQMTELDRHRRAQDLGQLVRLLENYRDQPADFDVSQIKAAGTSDRRKLIQEHLRDRLFEISRRNRLIYFKPSLQTLNLSVASVPLVMDVRNIRLEQLFVWHPQLAASLSSGEALSLGKYLRVEDAPYIPGVLDKIISEARRDRAEYGFAQLRLVLCFLRWHNLKDAPQERIHSPLLLLSVELTKRKGVRDQYVLTPTSTEAEVNPALRHHLKTLYGIALPESIDLQETSLDAFFVSLQAQIHASEPGVMLEKIDRPKIELIHARARQRLDQWRQRQRVRSSSTARTTVESSYDRENYRPRGLQLFIEKIRPQPCPLADIAGAPPRPRVPSWVADADPAGKETPGAATAPTPPVIETEREMFALRDGESGNPYRWSYDLCSLTLGNFHYRKMTLVRDYAKLGEEELVNPAFDSVFSLEPKRTDEPAAAPLPLSSQYPVIPRDAAQAAAVARSRDGRSFIIQGPPGTGKSQTITNLIADYVARGKRVLFVCEKRAAIDVVFHRLRQQGLDELCCLIHDSQADKKKFILNLKQTYEQWLAAAPDEDSGRIRAEALRGIEHDLVSLDRFSQAMTDVPEPAGVTVRSLLHRLVDVHSAGPELSPEEEEKLPSYRFWLSHGELALRLQQSLVQLGAEPCFARHPLRWLGRDVILSPRPVEQLRQHLDEIDGLLDSLESSLELSGLSEELWDTVPEIEAILEFAHRIHPLAQRHQLALLDPSSGLSQGLKSLTAELAAAEKELKAALQATANWHDRLTSVDTINALEAAVRFEASFLRVLQPAYWRLRKTVRARYDFSKHAVEPSLRKVLEELQVEHGARQRLLELREKLSREYSSDGVEELAALLASARSDRATTLRSVVAFRHSLLANAGADQLVGELAQVYPQFGQFKATLSTLLFSHEELDFASLRHVLAELRRELRTLPDLLPVLTELADAPEPVRHALIHTPIALDQLEGAMAKKTLQDIYRADIGLNRFHGRLLDAHLERLDDHHRTWLKSNAGVIRAGVKQKFRENVQISNLAAAQLTEDQKVFKKNYATGRRELEHEFGKTMRYKSIRDLAAGVSGRVIRDLKPIWLMSPLSVSDTLPLDPDLFDVVIFDEASQIPVEEAVPAVYRARQVIVVGDEMQLPPTSFFSGARDSDEDMLVTEEAGERIEVDLEADSFLSQSGRNLPSTLLAWHYRSRYENLISFSNAAFYGGNLFTIPDRHLSPPQLKEISITDPAQAAPNAGELLTRSISFHFIENGIYEQRRNPSEARYIAHLVRELLGRETKLSIGIVAFSEAQQTEIERALDALGDEDKEFAVRLEAEMSREEDDQFCGLFVKNLENVQGDERDIILLSICYGYDRERRMLMNFGPINQRGGEKRLNVIFSRAKHHMAVITSIRHQDITNDYNDGANALRHFLRYAESLSRGDLTTARGVLENLNPLNRRALAPVTGRDAVIEQLAAALRQRGHTVDLNVGQSRFRCDLAIRSVDTPAYALGILVDTDAHYRNANLIDRYLTQPSILRAFGWDVAHVLTKDWFHEPEAVIERLERMIRGEKIDRPELPDLPAESQAAPIVPSAKIAGATSPNSSEPENAAPKKPAARKPANLPERGDVSARPGSHRYLECVEGGARKFWEITVNGSAFTVRFGRLGTAGQKQQKTCETEAEAARVAEQLIAAKLKKGYVEARR